VGEAPADGSPLRALVIRLVLTEQSPERDIWRVTDAEYLPVEQAQLRMAEPLTQPPVRSTGEATQLPPQERNKLLRGAAMELLAALQKNDQPAIAALVIPGSPAAGKVQRLPATEGLATFQFQEMRRTGDLGWVLVHPDGADRGRTALLMHFHKQPAGGPTWLAADVESLPVGKAMERIRDLAPKVVPVTRSSLAGAEAVADAQLVRLKAQLEASGASAEVQARAPGGHRGSTRPGAGADGRVGPGAFGDGRAQDTPTDGRQIHRLSRPARPGRAQGTNPARLAG
jgi:hypothetical protein